MDDREHRTPVLHRGRLGLVEAAEPLRPGLLPGGNLIAVDGEVPEGVSAFTDWIADSADTEPEVEIHADDVWSLMHTSGTTALPKASMNTHVATTMASYDYALSYTRGLPFEQDIRMCTYLPVVHHVAIRTRARCCCCSCWLRLSYIC